jgi:hypothetical protein
MSVIGFRTRFLLARLHEIFGDFAGAARMVERGNVPNRYVSLRDAYRLHMLVLANPMEKGPSIIEAAQDFEWFHRPSSAADQYAAYFCRYVAAAVNGDITAKNTFTKKLADLQVMKVYRNALRVV